MIPAADGSARLTMRAGWWLAPALGSAIILLAARFAVPPMRDALTLQPVPGARLALSTWYIVMAPFCDVLDRLSLLAVREHIALLLTAIVLYVAWRVLRRPEQRSALREVRLGARALGVLVCIYGIGVLAPRPMAALALADPEKIIVDFHSHTNASHDGRPDFTPARNREWHRGAGFDVAYVTDHRTFDGAAAAAAGNPLEAGAGVSLLSGLEMHYRRKQVNTLGVTDATWLRAYVDPIRSLSPVAQRLASLPEPVRIMTIPETLLPFPAPDSLGRTGVLAIELSDGAPRGIAQTQRDRAWILRLADSLNLAVVAGSNNHGWGRTAVGWSVLRIPGWRALPPDSVGALIEHEIRTRRRAAVQVIVRRSPDPARSTLAIVLTAPAVAWRMLTTLSPAERASWLAWLWIAAFSVALFSRASRTTHRAPAP